MTAHLTFTVPLTARERHIADLARTQHARPEKSTRVYHQFLALYAVNFYCQCMGIETELSESRAWDVLIRSLSDSIELTIKGLGKLECCPVYADTEWVEVSPEAFGDRIGYIAVQISPHYDKAVLVGFLEEVCEEKIPIAAWQSLESFLDCLEDVPVPQPVASPLVRLDRWLQNLFDTGWEAVESIVAPKAAAMAFRKPSVEPIVERVKTIELDRLGERVFLFIGLCPASDGEIEIWVRFASAREDVRLPLDLEVKVLDEYDTVVMQARSRGTRTLQLDFSVEPGEIFKVQIELGDFTMVERFAI